MMTMMKVKLLEDDEKMKKCAVSCFERCKKGEKKKKKRSTMTICLLRFDVYNKKKICPLARFFLNVPKKQQKNKHVVLHVSDNHVLFRIVIFFSLHQVSLSSPLWRRSTVPRLANV
jgi:hypothetical protein